MLKLSVATDRYVIVEPNSYQIRTWFHFLLLRPCICISRALHLLIVDGIRGVAPFAELGQLQLDEARLAIGG